MKTIMRTVFGSHLYGTNTPTSDFDFKSIHIPDARSILLQNPANSISDRRDKEQGEKNFVGEEENESYSLQRYLYLVTKGETVALDMLFAPDDKLEVSSPLWDRIRANKDKLISKRTVAFVGYCRKQANKYGVKGSRVAAAEKAMKFFEEGLKTNPHGKVGDLAKDVDGNANLEILFDEHTQVIQQPVNKAGDIGTFLECVGRKIDFRSTIREAHKVFTAIFEEYGARARAARDEKGIDWKALSHAVRVGIQAQEFLATGHMTFPLAESERIMQIKQGKLPYATVEAWIEQIFVDVEKAAEQSTLPEKPNQKFIDNLVVEVYGEEVLNALPGVIFPDGIENLKIPIETRMVHDDWLKSTES